MTIPRKKPARVRSMDGRPFEDDVITEFEYEVALQAQEIVLLAEGQARRILGRIRVRLERGAQEASARYYFDARLGIVRRREHGKEKTGS
jgi:hypothetical protein